MASRCLVFLKLSLGPINLGRGRGGNRLLVKQAMEFPQIQCMYVGMHKMHM